LTDRRMIKGSRDAKGKWEKLLEWYPVQHFLFSLDSSCGGRFAASSFRGMMEAGAFIYSSLQHRLLTRFHAGRVESRGSLQPVLRR